MSHHPTDLNPSLKTAVVWSLVEELMRRHHQKFDLRLRILHPGGGQYFCVTLYDDNRGREVAMWNLAGTSVTIVNPIGTPRCQQKSLPWHETGYQTHAISHGIDAVVADMEALLGLPDVQGKHGPTTPPVLGVRLIAESARRSAFRSRYLVAESGYHDSSGAEGSSSSEWLAHFPAVHAAVQAQRGDFAAASSLASRCWSLRLFPDGDSAERVLLDLATAEVVASGKNIERIDAMRAFREHGRRVAPVVDWIESRLSPP